ncbi:MAG: hypothetical protein AABY22_00635 [Nanoarchaeota archaeon]
MITICCLNCNKEFKIFHCQIKIGKKFCSKKCFSKYRSVTIICESCHKEKRMCGATYRKTRGRFCSKKCANNIRKGIPRTEEHKKNMSIAQKNRISKLKDKNGKLIQTKKQKESTRKLIELNKTPERRIRSQELREKIRKANLGRKYPPEVAQKRWETIRAKPIEEQEAIIEKTRQKLKGQKRSKAFCENAKKNFQKYWDNNTPSFKNTKTIKGLNHKVRSFVEAKVCLLLKKFKIPYEYEKRFKVPHVDGRRSNYFADITIWNSFILEVKGHCFNKNLWKIDACAKAYPTYKVIVVTNEKRFKEIIQKEVKSDVILIKELEEMIKNNYFKKIKL